MSSEDNDLMLRYSFQLGADSAYADRSGTAPEPSAPAEPVIEFLCDPALEGRLPAPERASRFMPDWFKSLEREMGMRDPNGLPGLTVKACLPVTDAFTLGWIIPLPVTVQLTVPEDRVNIQAQWPVDAPFQPLEQHHPGQIGAPNPPFERTMPLKWMNPWRIRVPEGYSVLFTQPFNHFQLPFTCFTGLVDCDQFLPAVNFPFAWTGAPGEHTLPAGLPMIQAIPIPRPGLIKQEQVRPASDEEWRAQAEAHERKQSEESVYRREWRERK